MNKSKKSSLKISKLWQNQKKLWVKYRIVKGKNDQNAMREVERNLIDVHQKLDIQPPVFLIQEVIRSGKKG